MSDVSEEETDPIGDKMMEPASKEKSETERMDTDQDLTEREKDKEREVTPPPKVLYDSKKANKKPTTKKPKVMTKGEMKQMAKAIQGIPKQIYSPSSPTGDVDLEVINTEKIDEPEENNSERTQEKPKTKDPKTKDHKTKDLKDKGIENPKKDDRIETRETKKITPIRMEPEKTKKKPCDICSNVESYSGLYEDVIHQRGHISSKTNRKIRMEGPTVSPVIEDMITL